MQPWVVGKDGYARMQTQKIHFCIYATVNSNLCLQTQTSILFQLQHACAVDSNMLQDALHHHVL